MNIEELVIKYAALMPVRFKFKQKYLFINEIAKEYQALGYEVKATVNKKRGRRALNLMIGDVANAKTLIISHYDTPQKNFGNPLKYYPFNGSFSFVKSFVAYFTPLILGSLVVLYLLVEGMKKVDFTNNLFQSLFIVIALFVTVALSSIMTKGVANKYNFNKNTSGVIGNLLLAEKMANRKGVAFVLTDMGCMDRAGDKMLQEALPTQLKDKKVIILDCIGKGSRVGIGYREEYKQGAEQLISQFKDQKIFSIQLDENAIKYSSAKYYQKSMIISYGKKQNNEFLVDDTSCSKDTVIDHDIVTMIVENIAKFLTR